MIIKITKKRKEKMSWRKSRFFF